MAPKITDEYCALIEVDGRKWLLSNSYAQEKQNLKVYRKLTSLRGDLDNVKDGAKIRVFHRQVTSWRKFADKIPGDLKNIQYAIFISYPDYKKKEIVPRPLPRDEEIRNMAIDNFYFSDIGEAKKNLEYFMGKGRFASETRAEQVFRACFGPSPASTSKGYIYFREVSDWEEVTL